MTDTLKIISKTLDGLYPDRLTDEEKVVIEESILNYFIRLTLTDYYNNQEYVSSNDVKVNTGINLDIVREKVQDKIQDYLHGVVDFNDLGEPVMDAHKRVVA